MTGSPFDDLARELPDGAFWPTGAWFKKVFDALTADRIRAGSNLDELPHAKGRTLNARAGGDDSSVAPSPLTVVDASAKDAQGNTHPGRVRVYKGFLMGLRPAEMNLVDGVLPDGTDNRCYLTCPEGTVSVYGKVLVDTTLGVGTQSHVYTVDSPEEPDGTYLYLLIAQVTTTNGVPAIEQIWTGNWSPVPLSSGDGSIIYPAGS